MGDITSPEPNLADPKRSEAVITLRDFTATTLILSDQPAAELELTNHTG